MPMIDLSQTPKQVGVLYPLIDIVSHTANTNTLSVHEAANTWRKDPCLTVGYASEDIRARPESPALLWKGLEIIHVSACLI